MKLIAWPECPTSSSPGEPHPLLAFRSNYWFQCLYARFFRLAKQGASTTKIRWLKSPLSDLITVLRLCLSSNEVEDTVMSPFSSNECDASWPSTSSKEHEESTSPNSKGKGKKSSLSPDSDKEIEVSNKLTVPEVSSLSLTDSQQSLERGSSSSSIFSDINGLSTENVENDYLDSDSLDSDSLNSDLLNSESFNNTQVSGTPVTASILTGAVSQYETDSFARFDLSIFLLGSAMFNLRIKWLRVHCCIITNLTQVFLSTTYKLALNFMDNKFDFNILSSLSGKHKVWSDFTRHTSAAIILQGYKLNSRLSII